MELKYAHNLIIGDKDLPLIEPYGIEINFERKMLSTFSTPFNRTLWN